jgi:ABC-type cobalamin/Fe3+-siderophores transport system ATPase subunit
MLELVNIGYQSIVQNCSVTIPSGQITTILGRNGTGKSTLLKLVSGELIPTQGEVLLNHRPLNQYSPLELAQRRAILSQTFAPNDHLIVLDYLRLARHPYWPLRSSDYDLIDQFVALYELEALLDRRLITLSGGELQRLRFLGALLQISPLEHDESKILFLDEITNSLDLAYQLQFLRLLQTIVKEHRLTVLMILHDFNLARQISDFIILMNHGRIEHDGPPELVMTAAILQNVFTVTTTTTQLGNQTYLLPRI